LGPYTAVDLAPEREGELECGEKIVRPADVEPLDLENLG
jgi:hypothetical protein